MNDASRPPAPFANLNEFMVAQGAALRAGDAPPRSRAEWEQRKAKLRAALFAAMGPFPDQPCELQPKIVDTLKRDGFRIEKLLFQSRPDVWVTGSAYVPEKIQGKLPAVLVVHGHWAIARRDPVVQARCLGLVKLGFFVLAVDAFGAGERFMTPGVTGYHGELIGSSLWPAGQTLLGMQVYDNRRAVDYLLTRPEVDGSKLGITGASGGGNQTMYAGGLDERFAAVVPVCSVGNYQAYLKSACCVCEVLPGALRFTEEGDVLGLTAPRALLVISATRDSFNFHPEQAAISVERARAIHKLFGTEAKVRHAIFESPHAYNQAMREAMYGWMTKWLKGQGDGAPIPEPSHETDKPEVLACFPGGKRPAEFMLPPMFAGREARRLLAPYQALKFDHPEGWESVSVTLRSRLRKVLGETPKLPPTASARVEKPTIADSLQTQAVTLEPEPGLRMFARVQGKAGRKGPQATCVLLHLDGQAEAIKHPLANVLTDRGWTVATADLRGTGASKLPADLIGGAPDHNSAEHALWIGRPLLGQWTFDTLALLDWLASQAEINGRQIAVVGLGQAGLVALCTAALHPRRVAGVGALESPATLVTDLPYGKGTRMGILVPGLLTVGDMPQLAALSVPHRLILAAGLSPQGRKLTADELRENFAFTRGVYNLAKRPGELHISDDLPAEKVVAALEAIRTS